MVESDTELGLQVAERRKNRRKSFAPMHPGLQTWVETKGLAVDKNDGQKPSSELLLPIGKKKKATYEELRELVNAGKIKETKNSVRDNDWDLTEEIRSRLWPLLDSIHETNRSSLDGFYWDTATQLYGSEQVAKAAPEEELALPGFTDPQNRLYYALSPEGIARCKRIVSVVGYAYPEITYCPMMLPVSSLFLHFITEEETYNCICTLLSARHKVFLTQTKSEWDVAYITAMHLTKKFSKTAFTFLLRNVKQGEKLENVFQGWIWWIFRDLPLAHLVRVADCFLMEGMKVLYRTTIALLLSFTKTCSSDSTWSKYLESAGLESAISKYCREFSMTPQRLLKSAFSIRAFRGSEIRKVSTKVEMLLKSNKSSSALPKMKRSKSNENLPSSQSQMDIQMMSHTLAIKELLVLWQWLPVRITMYQPVLLYTSDEHGCSLTTFFNRVENHEPTILIIKTTTDEVFGAYCSSMWAVRNQKDERGERQRYFGTGETFLFTLGPEKRQYPWVGIKPPVDNSDGEAENDEDSPNQNNSRSRHRGDELFMHADTHMISIGGGQGQGICLDEDLRFGKTESCLTFNNPPLCESKDFEVRVLEVIGFTGM
ncbi:TBC1 domain family member 24 [Orchesella cincta]|uniref:TBC1 domain family member 24 n=1 Tax=Orchesella cincta TaxID=48709 RepID=A0A1D2NH63_ORCCI|nr:TBC1 domain family member 24 [Orchesella cincta]